MKNHYDTLGVSPQAPPEVIKAAGRALALKLHPDTNHGGARGSINEVNEALDVLGDPRSRAAHDAALIKAPAFKANPLIPYQVQADAHAGRQNLHFFRRTRFVGYIVLPFVAWKLHGAAIPVALGLAALAMCVAQGWRTLSARATLLRAWAQRTPATTALAEALGQRPRALFAAHAAGAVAVGPFAVAITWWRSQHAIAIERRAKKVAKAVAKAERKASGRPWWSTT